MYVRKSSVRLLIYLALIILLSLLFSQNKVRVVSRVIDGDTIILGNGEKVRLIGINAPELKLDKKYKLSLGKNAKTYLKSLIEGKQVKLSYDLQSKDKYGRTLAYVYLMDGTFINAMMLRKGHAKILTKYPFTKKKDFLIYQEMAKSKSLGIWDLKSPYINIQGTIRENKNLHRIEKDN